jgi:hypothetical protein
MNAVIVMVGLAFFVLTIGAGAFIAIKTRSDLHRADERITKLSQAVNGKHVERHGRHSSKIMEINPELKVVKGGREWGG